MSPHAFSSLPSNNEEAPPSPLNPSQRKGIRKGLRGEMQCLSHGARTAKPARRMGMCDLSCEQLIGGVAGTALTW